MCTSVICIDPVLLHKYTHTTISARAQLHELVMIYVEKYKADKVHDIWHSDAIKQQHTNNNTKSPDEQTVAAQCDQDSLSSVLNLNSCSPESCWLLLKAAFRESGAVISVSVLLYYKTLKCYFVSLRVSVTCECVLTADHWVGLRSSWICKNWNHRAADWCPLNVSPTAFS